MLTHEGPLFLEHTSSQQGDCTLFLSRAPDAQHIATASTESILSVYLLAHFSHYTMQSSTCLSRCRCERASSHLSANSCRRPESIFVIIPSLPANPFAESIASLTHPAQYPSQEIDSVTDRPGYSMWWRKTNLRVADRGLQQSFKNRVCGMEP